jgi:nitroimidazol reductase NimA-like FMN-containing flavoprotein (pyridoxamine 5'-phosphate oxidase superfamily)
MKEQHTTIPDLQKIQEVIQNSLYCHLSCCAEDKPYLVPIAFGYDGNDIFFHTGQAGKKIDIWMKNPRVCLAFETNVKINTHPDRACDWSFSSQSVLMDGTVEEVTDPPEKEYALDQIMKQYSSKEWELPTDKVLQTRIWKVTPRDMTYKELS